MQKSLENHPKFIQKWSQNPSKNHSKIDTKKRMENKRFYEKNYVQNHEKWIGISRAYWILSRIKTNILQKDTRGKVQGRVHPKSKHILSQSQHAWRVPAARGRIFEWIFHGFGLNFESFFNDFSCFCHCLFEAVFLMIFNGFLIVLWTAWTLKSLIFHWF